MLHYIPTLGRQDGGTSVYMQQLAAQLGQLLELHVVCHKVENELTLVGATVHYLTLSWNYWKVRSEYRQLLDELKPDVVHVNCCWHPYFAYAVIWAREAGYKVVLTPHGMLEPWLMNRHYWTRKLPSIWLYQRRAVRMASMLHATAEEEREHLLQLGWNDKVTVIPNGIEVEKIAMRSDWERRGRIVYLGRIHPKKGVDELIRAFASWWSVHGTREGIGHAGASDNVLQIAGEGESSYLEELRRLAEQLGVADKVQWLGGVYGDDKWRLLQEADCLVLPTHSENFGIVVAEALASGTPVITTHGTPWQLLEEEHCGWWIAYGAQPLTEALAKMMACDTMTRMTMGMNGRRVVEERFGTRRVAERMREMYEWVTIETKKMNAD